MDSNTQGFTSYWRNTLADAESGKGAFERKDEDSFTQWMNVDQRRLGEEIVQSFFKGEDEQVKTVEVLLRPQVWIRQLKHGKERTAGAPGIVTPLVTAALLNREGFLFPTKLRMIQSPLVPLMRMSCVMRLMNNEWNDMLVISSCGKSTLKTLMNF